MIHLATNIDNRLYYSDKPFPEKNIVCDCITTSQEGYEELARHCPLHEDACPYRRGTKEYNTTVQSWFSTALPVVNETDVYLFIREKYMSQYASLFQLQPLTGYTLGEEFEVNRNECICPEYECLLGKPKRCQSSATISRRQSSTECEVCGGTGVFEDHPELEGNHKEYCTACKKDDLGGSVSRESGEKTDSVNKSAEKPLREHFENETDASTTLRTFAYIEALEQYIESYERERKRVEELEKENQDYIGKVTFYRIEVERLRLYAERNKIGKPNQKLFDALYDHIIDLRNEKDYWENHHRILETESIIREVIEICKAHSEDGCFDADGALVNSLKHFESLYDNSPGLEEQAVEEQKETGMDKLTIHRFEAKTIENALRLAMNVLDSRNQKDETAMDRELIRADKFIKEVFTRKQ
jgi:hypothetical protein